MSGAPTTYEEFLRGSLERHFHDSAGERVGILALLLAAPEAWQVAVNEVSKEGLTKPLLAGALSMATLTTALRIGLSGPLGLALTGLSVGALVAVYKDAPEEIRRRAAHARQVVDRFRDDFDDLARERAKRPLREGQWALMMGALESRFLAELAEGGGHDPASVSGLGEHFVAPSLMPPRPPKR